MNNEYILQLSGSRSFIFSNCKTVFIWIPSFKKSYTSVCIYPLCLDERCSVNACHCKMSVDCFCLDLWREWSNNEKTMRTLFLLLERRLAVVKLKPNLTLFLMFGTTVRLLYKSYIFWVVPYGGYWHQCAAVTGMIKNHFMALYVTASSWFH